MGAGADWPCGNARIITSNLDTDEKELQLFLSRPEAFFPNVTFFLCFFHWRLAFSLHDEPTILSQSCNLFSCITVKGNGHQAVIPLVLLIDCTFLLDTMGYSHTTSHNGPVQF